MKLSKPNADFTTIIQANPALEKDTEDRKPTIDQHPSRPTDLLQAVQQAVDRNPAFQLFLNQLIAQQGGITVSSTNQPVYPSATEAKPTREELECGIKQTPEHIKISSDEEDAPTQRHSAPVIIVKEEPFSDAAMHSGNRPSLQDLMPAPLLVDRKCPARDASSNHCACSPSTV
jgi:hypothetical protein